MVEGPFDTPGRVPDTVDSSLITQAIEDLSKHIREGMKFWESHFVDDENGIFDIDSETDALSPLTGEKLAAFLNLRTTLAESMNKKDELIEARDLVYNFGARDREDFRVWKSAKPLTDRLEKDIQAARRLYPSG